MHLFYLLDFDHIPMSRTVVFAVFSVVVMVIQLNSVHDHSVYAYNTVCNGVNCHSMTM